MVAISIIVPVYIVEEYLERCINSILSQTLTNYELILVDDGSTEKSGEICDDFAKRDSRIIVVHKSNEGVSKARNLAVVLSKGEYITFVDSDDWISPNMLESLYNACRNNKAPMAIGKYTLTKEYYCSDTQMKTEYTVMDKRDAIEYYFNDNIKDINVSNSANIKSPWGKLIRRDIVLNNLFPENRSYAEDAACVYKWIWKSELIVDVSEKLYYYFQNPDGICEAPFGLHLVGLFQTQKEWMNFFRDNGYPDLYQAICKEYIETTCFYYVKERKLHHQDTSKVFYDLLKDGLLNYAEDAGINMKNTPEPYHQVWPVLTFPAKVINKLKKVFCH